MIKRYGNQERKAPEMSMIPCSEDCVYQRDGYCSLDIPPLVTNTDAKGCVHKISLDKKHPPIPHPEITIPSQPQRPL